MAISQDVQRERELERVKTMRRLMQQDHAARELVRWLVDVSGAMQSRYIDNANLAAFESGRRQVGMAIVALAQEAGVIGELLEKEA